jgi:hypothetical protein
VNNLGAEAAKALEGSLSRSVAAAGDGVAENMNVQPAGQCRLGRGGHAGARVQPGHDDLLNAMLAQHLLKVRVAERITPPFGHVDGTGCGEPRVPARPRAAGNRGASPRKVPYKVARPELVADLDNQVAASLGLSDRRPGGRKHRLHLISRDRHPPGIGEEIVLKIDEQQRPASVRSSQNELGNHCRRLRAGR